MEEEAPPWAHKDTSIAQVRHRLRHDDGDQTAQEAAPASPEAAEDSTHLAGTDSTVAADYYYYYYYLGY